MSPIGLPSTYNATIDAFVIPSHQVELIKCSYLLTLYYGTMMGASYMIFIAFLLLSTKQQRQKPSFPLMLASFIMLVTTSHLVVIHTGQTRRAFFAKTAQDMAKHQTAAWRLFITSNISQKLTCLVANMAVAIKIKSCFPSPRFTLHNQRLLICPLISLLVIRFTFVVAFSVEAIKSKRHPMFITDLGDFSVQVAFSLYATLILLCKASSSYNADTQYQDANFKRRLRFSIEAILFTLLVPMMFQLACLIILVQVLLGTYDGYLLLHFDCFNLFATVLFALFSTTWSVIRSRTGTDSISDGKTGKEHSMAFVTSFFATEAPERPKECSPSILPSEITLGDGANSTQEDVTCIPSLHFNLETSVFGGELQLAHPL